MCFILLDSARLSVAKGSQKGRQNSSLQFSKRKPPRLEGRLFLTHMRELGRGRLDAEYSPVLRLRDALRVCHGFTSPGRSESLPARSRGRESTSRAFTSSQRVSSGSAGSARDANGSDAARPDSTASASDRRRAVDCPGRSTTRLLCRSARSWLANERPTARLPDARELAETPCAEL